MITTRQKIICILLVVLTFAALLGTYIAAGLSVQYDVAVGGVCPEDIYATRSIVDTVTTEARKKAAADSVEDVYTTDFGKVDLSVSLVNLALTKIRDARESLAKLQAGSTSDISALTLPRNETYLSDDVYSVCLVLSSRNFNTLAELVPLAVQTVMTEGVTSKADGIKAFNRQLGDAAFSDEMQKIAENLASGAISVNKAFDSEETENQRVVAANAVSNITYMKNQIIARKGEIITNAQHAMLKELGFVKGSTQIDFFHTFSVIFLLLLVIALVVLYCLTIGRDAFFSKPVTLVTICSSLTILGSLIILLGIKSGGGNLIYILPLSVIPSLIALLLGANLSSIVNIITAVLAGIQTNDMSITLSLIIAGSAAAYLFSRVRRRAHLLSATLFSAFCYALSYSAIFIDTSKSILDVLIIFSYSFAGAFFGGILTIGTIPFCEAIFDVITPMKLGELSNPEHKLLKKLLLVAPGTYHHSLTVANMADAAASEVNANSLLARVGAYYHDIGKMENPLYFKENQFGIDNPHDALPPEESAAILLKHVSSGYNLAIQHRLPTAVRDIILQHHGTTTASYFLYKAKCERDDVDAALFTYPGPAPQTKEATIIMLADACEAAVRAMREKGSVDASVVVNDIVNSRIGEGQLVNSSLTFSDLEKVKASFVKTLDQYFHKRIIYPQNEKKD